MRHVTVLVIALLTFGAAGCGPAPPPQEQEEGPTRADSVSEALQAFDASAFEDIPWGSEEVRTERGRIVYDISCARCHGAEGRGDAGFVMEGDTLRPPSFLADDWAFAEAPMRLRRYIYSGSVAGMPYWGLVGLKYSDLDAVAHFIETTLREEVDGGQQGS